MPSGPVMKTCQPSSARARPLAIATTTLNRIVVVASSPLDACTMKVTAIPFCAMHNVTLGTSVPNFVPAPESERGIGTGFHGQSIQEVFESLLPGYFGHAIG